MNGSYSTSDYNASFVGFVPSRKPVFTIIVVIDSPHAKGHTGGVAAAPVFKRIAQAAMRQYGVPPSINPAPPLVVARHDAEDEDAHEQPTSTGGSTPTPMALGDVARITRVPDLRGLGAGMHPRADAARHIGRLNGTGIVTRQRPGGGARRSIA